MLLGRDGAQLFAKAFDGDGAAALRKILSSHEASTRLAAIPGLAPLILPADAIARELLGPAARAVRALFFDKNEHRNWALGWHQDRTIAVRARRDVPGFSA